MCRQALSSKAFVNELPGFPEVGYGQTTIVQMEAMESSPAANVRLLAEVDAALLAAEHGDEALLVSMSPSSRGFGPACLTG